MLTKRECEVMRLVSQGFTNAEIANILQISFHTAKAHVAAVLRKLNVKNRLLAALKFSYIP